MARDFEDFLDEDECCLNCGEIDYVPSKTMGVCIDCRNELMSGDFTLSDDSTSLEEAIR